MFWVCLYVLTQQFSLPSVRNRNERFRVYILFSNNLHGVHTSVELLITAQLGSGFKETVIVFF